MANDITLKSKSGVSKYPKTYSRNILDKDTTPTEDSTNVITSGGVYDALDGKLDTSYTGSTGAITVVEGSTAASPIFGVTVTDGQTTPAMQSTMHLQKDGINLNYNNAQGIVISDDGVEIGEDIVIEGTVSGANNLLTTSSIASASNLGGIKVGTGLNVDSSTGAGKVEGVEYKNAAGTAQANALKFVKCTQAEYTALGTYDSDTMYVIIG